MFKGLEIWSGWRLYLIAAGAFAALAAGGPAHAQEVGENRAWQFETPQEIAARAAVADLIAKQRAGIYAAPVYNTVIARQYNCSVVATATGNSGAQSALANSPTVAGASSAATGSLRVTIRPTRDADAAIEREGRSGYLYDRRFLTLSEARPRPLPAPYRTITVDAGTGEIVPEVPLPSDPDRPADATLFATLPNVGRAWATSLPPGRFDTVSVLNVERGGRALACGEACSSRIAGRRAFPVLRLRVARKGSGLQQRPAGVPTVAFLADRPVRGTGRCSYAVDRLEARHPIVAVVQNGAASLNPAMRFERMPHDPEDDHHIARTAEPAVEGERIEQAVGWNGTPAPSRRE